MLIPRPMPREPPVTTATLPLSLSSAMSASHDSLFGYHGLPLGAALVAVEVDDVAGGAGAEPAGERPALRRAGVDHVAGVEHHVPAEVPRQVQHRENHVRG